MQKRLVLVAGAGRSGTSLFSGVFKALGCHVPQPEVQADNTNPMGFSEPQWVVDFHSKLLRRASVHVVDARPVAWAKTAQVALRRKVEDQLREWLEAEFEQLQPVLVKDPRLLWFTSLWDVVGASMDAPPSYVTMLREPQAVMHSRRSSYGDRRLPTSAVAGWINTMLYTERATRDSLRAYPKYDDLLEDWTTAVSKVCSALELPILEDATAPQMRKVNELVDPSLRRSPSTWDGMGVHREVADMADETYRLFLELASADEAGVEVVQKDLDRMRDEYAKFYELAESVAESSIVKVGRERAAERRAQVRSQRYMARKAAKLEAKTGIVPGKKRKPKAKPTFARRVKRKLRRLARGRR